MKPTKNNQSEIDETNENEYIEVFPDLRGTENLLNVSFVPGENEYLDQNNQEE